jgi:hypothetical protein
VLKSFVEKIENKKQKNFKRKKRGRSQLGRPNQPASPSDQVISHLEHDHMYMSKRSQHPWQFTFPLFPHLFQCSFLFDSNTKVAQYSVEIPFREIISHLDVSIYHTVLVNRMPTIGVHISISLLQPL